VDRLGTAVAAGGQVVRTSLLARLSWSSVGDARPRAAQWALVALLLAEILYLTIGFDSQGLEDAPSLWTKAVGWSPQYLRLAVTIAVVGLLLNGRQFLAANPRDQTPRAAGWRLIHLASHGLALWLFVWITAQLFTGNASVAPQPPWYALAWTLAGMLALVTWALAFWPADRWRSIVSRQRRLIGWSVALGTGVWAAGFATEALWAPLARFTFGIVAAVLGVIYPHIVSNPDKLVIGTASFKVAIAPQCSGYEGVGLIVAFLGSYLWLSRKDLRFPGALALLPLGVAAIWVLNALRIVALVVIGTSGWPAIARGGFHSQAGWLAFNAVGLGLVALVHRGRYFAAQAVPAPVVGERPDQTLAFLAPLMAVIASAMLTGAFSAGVDWLYPLRVVVALGVLWMFRKRYANLGWAPSWRAIAIGAATFVLWLALLPAAAGGADHWPAALEALPVQWAAVWLCMRVVGYVITVPLVEELAFRGYLARRLIRADFERVPVGVFSWWSFLVSSAIFGAFHGGLWPAATVAGMAFALALYQRRALGDAVQAHATTNGLIALYVFSTGRWSVWS
jgi:exosortase E/protease (VPEID-CTERM system)